MNIHEFLDPKAILIQSEAKTSEEVIRTLGTRLFELGYVKDGFVEATLEREATMPTGLPLGGEINAAIPHVDIEFVHKSALGLITLKEPVLFCNMVDQDEQVPVKLVIMLALDQPKSQIEMLQSVAGLLQQPELITTIMAARQPQDILDALKSAD
jgi:PTS system galactitol-specific IIA component